LEPEKTALFKNEPTRVFHPLQREAGSLLKGETFSKQIEQIHSCSLGDLELPLALAKKSNQQQQQELFSEQIKIPSALRQCKHINCRRQ